MAKRTAPKVVTSPFRPGSASNEASARRYVEATGSSHAEGQRADAHDVSEAGREVTHWARSLAVAVRGMKTSLDGVHEWEDNTPENQIGRQLLLAYFFADALAPRAAEVTQSCREFEELTGGAESGA